MKNLVPCDKPAYTLEASLAACDPTRSAANQISGTSFGECLAKALTGICGMLNRLEASHSSRVMRAWVGGDLKGKDYKVILPKNMHSLAHALGMDWNAEVSALESGSEIPFLAGKFSVAEASFAAMASDYFRSDIFCQVRETITTYAHLFFDKWTHVLSERAASMRCPLQIFFDKYQVVVGPITQWTLKEINWVFKVDETDQVNNDMTKFREGRKLASEFVTELDVVANRHSEVGKLQELLKMASEKKGELQEMIQKCGKVHVFMAYTSLVLYDTTTKKQVDETDKYAMKTFGFKRDVLPEKLIQGLKDLEKRLHNKEAMPEVKDKDDKHEKKSKKEKDRSDRKDKQKDRDIPVPKVKKSKK